MAPLTKEEVEALLAKLAGWTLDDGAKEIRKSFPFPDFKSALQFADEVGRLAESEGHHPELSVGWGHVDVMLSTHAIGGLSENDFILAAKIDEMHR